MQFTSKNNETQEKNVAIKKVTKLGENNQRNKHEKEWEYISQRELPCQRSTKRGRSLRVFEMPKE